MDAKYDITNYLWRCTIDSTSIYKGESRVASGIIDVKFIHINMNEVFIISIC